MSKNPISAAACILGAALSIGACAHADNAPANAPAPVEAAAPFRVTAPNAKVEKLAGGFEFTEGPASDAAGNVFFTDQPNNRILKWSVEGKLSTFMENAGRSNGLSVDSQGRLLACADEKNQLWRIETRGLARGLPQVLVSDFGGKKLNGPNDVWVAPSGGIYFSDPFYKRPYWTRGATEQDTEGVYFLAPERKNQAGTRQLSRVVGDLKQPNGLIGTPDGKTLYVADIGAGKTYSYRIQRDGSLTDKKLFCEMGSDGMTIDDEGHIYLTGRGVTVFDKSGRQIERIAVEEGWTANVCFGGADRRSLFITAGKSLYRIPMRTRGVGSQ